MDVGNLWGIVLLMMVLLMFVMLLSSSGARDVFSGLSVFEEEEDMVVMLVGEDDLEFEL